MLTVLLGHWALLIIIQLISVLVENLFQEKLHKIGNKWE